MLWIGKQNIWMHPLVTNKAEAFLSTSSDKMEGVTKEGVEHSAGWMAHSLIPSCHGKGTEISRLMWARSARQ